MTGIVAALFDPCYGRDCPPDLSVLIGGLAVAGIIAERIYNSRKRG